MRFIWVLGLLTYAACGGRAELSTSKGSSAPDASTGTAGALNPSCKWGFAPMVSYSAGVAPVAVAIGDLDGDGHADLAVNNYGGDPGGITLNTLRNRGDATFEAWQTHTSTVAFTLSVGPLLSNTSMAVLVGCDLFPNDGAGRLGDPIVYSAVGGCGSQDSINNLAVGDFDGDGRLDFGWAPLARGVFVFLNRGGGSFDAVPTDLSAATPYMDTMTGADFDRDGLPDLAGVSWGYGYPSYLRMFHNGGAAHFTETDLDQGDQTPKVIAAGDLNGDGWPDLVINYPSTGMAVLLNREDGTFSAPTTYLFVGEVRSIAIGDLNGDGANDILFAGYTFANLGVFFNHGDGTFADAELWNVSTNPWNLALGDLNGDGHLDIAVAEAGGLTGNVVDVFLSRCQ